MMAETLLRGGAPALHGSRDQTQRLAGDHRLRPLLERVDQRCGIVAIDVERLPAEGLGFFLQGVGGLRGPPHDHGCPAVVGLVEGAEQYRLYRRDREHCAPTGVVRVAAPDVAVLDEDLVHAMWNEPGQGGLSLHLYGNAHFKEPKRRMWDPVTLKVEPFDSVRQLSLTMAMTAAAAAEA